MLREAVRIVRVPALGIALMLCVGGAPALAVDDGSDTGFATPRAGKQLVPIGYSAPESASDTATIYLNDHSPSGPFVFFSTTGRRPDWGEHVTLVPNPPAPLEIRTIEFSVMVTATSTVVAQFDIWDTYNTAASPVNSGLLRSAEANYGTVLANTASEFYSQVLFPFATPVPLADPDVFVEFKFKTATGAGAPLNTACRPIADVNPAGPNLGTSENDVYTDQNMDGIFTFSAPNVGDRRVFSSPDCTPTECQTNWHLHIRGSANAGGVVIDPGMDLYETPAGGASFDNNPIAPGFFDFDDSFNNCVPAGSPCDPNSIPCSLQYTGGIVFVGQPLNTSPAGVLSATDTIVSRATRASLPTPGSSATIPIEIVALSLVSANPITVSYAGGGGTTQWSVRMVLPDPAVFSQSPGSMTISRGNCPGEGGTFSSTLPVLPKLIFTQTNPPPTAPCTGRITLDPAPTMTLQNTEGRWLEYAPAGMRMIEDAFPGDRVDADADPMGSFETVLPATTYNFHPGVGVPRCPADATCTPVGAPIRRLSVEQASLAAHGVLAAAQPTTDGDGDFIQDPADNCPGVSNPLQSDTDRDGVGQACDNCAAVCNPAQESADGDSSGDACDCAPSDPLNGPPGEVANFRAQSKQSFQGTATANAVRYDAVRGRIPALPLGPGAGDEVCFDNLASPAFNDSATPLVGPGVFYLLRAENDCAPEGRGTWGREGLHGVTAAQRVTTTCP